MRSTAAPASALLVSGVLAVEIPKHRLEDLGDGGRRHHAHAHHRHTIKDDGIGGRRGPGHLLGGVGEVERVGCGHRGIGVLTCPTIAHRAALVNDNSVTVA